MQIMQANHGSRKIKSAVYLSVEAYYSAKHKETHGRGENISCDQSRNISRRTRAMVNKNL